MTPNTIELQPCPVPPKKVVATVLPVGDDRVHQPKKKTYYVTVSNFVYGRIEDLVSQTDNKEVYHVLMTLKNLIEPFYNNSTGKYVVKLNCFFLSFFVL